MVITRTKRHFVVTTVAIKRLERFLPIDILLPSNVKKVTGVLATASDTGGRGTVTFQSPDAADIFHVVCVAGGSEEVSDEALLGIEDTLFDSSLPWVTGKVPRIHPVNVGGDATVLKAWYKADAFERPFQLALYVEYEGAEELVAVVPEDQAPEDSETQLAPQYIHL